MQIFVMTLKTYEYTELGWKLSWDWRDHLMMRLNNSKDLMMTKYYATETIFQWWDWKFYDDTED